MWENSEIVFSFPASPYMIHSFKSNRRAHPERLFHLCLCSSSMSARWFGNKRRSQSRRLKHLTHQPIGRSVHMCHRGGGGEEGGGRCSRWQARVAFHTCTDPLHQSRTRTHHTVFQLKSEQCALVFGDKLTTSGAVADHQLVGSRITRKLLL